jgi:hypothetical protein
MLTGILVLVIDGGSIQRQKRMAQTAADAGALAGAVEIMRHRIDSVEASARSETKRNGFQHGVGGDVITVTYPGTTSPWTGSGFVTVEVQRTAPTFFATIFGQTSSLIRARATAGTTQSDYCFLALDPTAPGSLTVDNPSTLTAQNCGIAVNSSSPAGANVTGSLYTPTIGVSGSNVAGLLSNYHTPSLEYDMPPMMDPLAYLAMPTVPNTCNYGSLTSSATISGAVTLNPGTYCGGMLLSPNAEVKLMSGLYILRGGGLDATGGSTTKIWSDSLVGSTGVTFFNTAPPTGASYGWGPIHIQSSNVEVHLRADTAATAPLRGILFYTNPAAPSTQVNVFKAGSTSSMDGTIYFPSQEVFFYSGANFVVRGGLVANKIQTQNGVSITFTGANGGEAFQALRRAVIVD